MRKQWILWIFASVIIHVAQPALSAPKEALVQILKKNNIEASSNMDEVELQKLYVGYFSLIESNYQAVDELIQCEKDIGEINDLVTYCIQALPIEKKGSLVLCMAQKKKKDWVKENIKYTQECKNFDSIVYQCVVSKWKDCILPAYLEQTQGSDKFSWIIIGAIRNEWKDYGVPYIELLKKPGSSLFEQAIAYAADYDWRHVVQKYLSEIQARDIISYCAKNKWKEFVDLYLEEIYLSDRKFAEGSISFSLTVMHCAKNQWEDCIKLKYLEAVRNRKKRPREQANLFAEIIYLCVINEWKKCVLPAYLEELTKWEKFSSLLNHCVKNEWYDLVSPYVAQIEDKKLRNQVKDKLLKKEKSAELQSAMVKIEEEEQITKSMGKLDL